MCVWVPLMRLRLHFSILFFFFARIWETNTATVHALFMNSSHKVWLVLSFHHKFYCSWTDKFHFSATFSLKMGLTVLFTHLKIILLQYFSVFSFSFQFSAVSKRILSLMCKLSFKHSSFIKKLVLTWIFFFFWKMPHGTRSW